MRVGQQGTLTRIWGPRGRRAVARRDLGFGSAYLFGAVCPERGAGAAVVMPTASLAAMNEHLAEISRGVSPGAHAVLVLDGAGWHAEAGLTVPANLTLAFLPPYSPELNPVEQLWRELRRRFFAHRLFATVGAVIDACCHAWNAVAADPDLIRSVTRFAWLPRIKP